ncbi:MAG: HPF/RaiA family ribosome-associated protein [Burkholderiaceae bacterium]
MHIHMVANEFWMTPSLREYLESRAHFAFSALRSRAVRISVRLRDLNGPKGGRDMMCQVSVAIPGQPEVVVKDVQEDMYAAIDKAVKRAAYRATRIIMRKRSAVKKSGCLEISSDEDQPVQS